jgi:iron(II)-dependent oxidoreductase
MSRPFREGRREFLPEKIAFAAILLSVCVTAFGYALWPRTASSQQGGHFTGMVLIPGGPFIMGRDGGPAGESPAHRVSLPTFYIDRNLVTATDFARFVQARGPTGPKGEMYLDVLDGDNRIQERGGVWVVDKGFENHPAGEVSWHGAAAYCQWRKKRLPSEAEWEKAARGTDGRLYPWGNGRPRPDLAFFGGFRGQTVPVGQYPKGASPYGVLDMAGQLWEWTRSLYRDYPYHPTDGRENLSVSEPRVTRGGSSSSREEGLTTTLREAVASYRQATGHAYFGFRCAASLDMISTAFVNGWNR